MQSLLQLKVVGGAELDPWRGGRRRFDVRLGNRLGFFLALDGRRRQGDDYLGIKRRIAFRSANGDFEVMLEVRLAQPVRRIATIVDRDIGLDALGLNRAAVRRVIASGRELEAGVGAERQDGLHRTLAECLSAHDDGALVVLQRASDDFRRRCGAAIDQHDHRHALDRGGKVLQIILAAPAHVVAFGRRETHLRVGCAAVGVDHQHVLRQEGGGDTYGNIEQASRVAAQIKHQTGKVALLVEIADRLRYVFAGVFLELNHAQIAVAGLDQLGPHAAEVDDFAGQRKRQRCIDILARDDQRDLRAGLAAHFLDRLGQGEAAGDGFVDLDDEVAGLDTRTECRGILDRRNDFDDPVFDADFDAEATELALGRDLQFLERIGIEKVGMRVQAVDHAVDGFADELIVRYRLDIVALDPAEHRRE